jgi:hypothetical protein
MLNGSSPARAQDNQQGLPTDEATEVEIGLRISPVPLNLAGKDLNLVGLGSYIVNAVSDCIVATTEACLRISIMPPEEIPTLASRKRPIRPSS